MRIKLIVVIVWVCFQGSPALCQTPVIPQERYDFTRAQDTIRKSLSKREIPSMAVAISLDGRIVYEVRLDMPTSRAKSQRRLTQHIDSRPCQSRLPRPGSWFCIRRGV